MTNPQATADDCMAVWNEEDSGRRRILLVDGWGEKARYVDPLMSGEGHEGIAVMIEKARAQLPGHRFRLSGMPDGYGDYVRFSWTLAPDGGAVVARGTDIVRLQGDGRIAEVVGFLDGAES
jgi:hypothetical protein